MQKKLAVVMPVYNEEECIAQVVGKWIHALDSLKIDYTFNVFNDGSKDQTLSILKSLQPQYPNLNVVDKKNSGHGPTILTGYRGSTESQWIFQIDSDDEIGPEKFIDLWNQRENYDFLIGSRNGRYSPLPRKIISFISRLVVWLFYGRGVWDVNSPFRLMRTEKFREIYEKIPMDTFAPNLIITGMACKNKMRILEMPVPYQDRQTGEVSIKKWKLLKAAARSFWQSVTFAFNSK